jgi:hypothetical protein
MSKVDKLGVKLFTYDKQDGSSTNQVTFEALLYYPSGSVNIQSSEDLMRTAASAQRPEHRKESGLRHPE